MSLCIKSHYDYFKFFVIVINSFLADFSAPDLINHPTPVEVKEILNLGMYKITYFAIIFGQNVGIENV